MPLFIFSKRLPKAAVRCVFMKYTLLTHYRGVHVLQSAPYGHRSWRRIQEVMTSHILESRLSDESPLRRRPATADQLDDVREPVSSVLAAYRQHTSSMPYWPAASPSGDVIMTSYGVGGAGYVVHPGPSGLVSPWMAPTPTPSVDRLSEFGCGGGYGSQGVSVVPPLSAYGGGVDLKPWTANNYIPSPSSAISPPFHAIPRLTGIHSSLLYLEK